MDQDEEEEESHVYLVSCQIKVASFAQAAMSVTCKKEGLPLVENHPKVIERRFSKMARGIMDVIPSLFF